MTLREDAMRSQPDFPWLSADAPDEVEEFLRSRGWLAGDERFEGCEPAGAGNMNLTLRIVSNTRSLVLKQARPWVERYDEIAAPWSRSESERLFYERVARIPGVRERMPRLLAADPRSHTLLLEYVEGEGDFTDLYDPGLDRGLSRRHLEQAADLLAHLHASTWGRADPQLSNREMRALNHAHLFEVPLDSGNGLELDGFEPGLADAADSLMRDTRYRGEVDAAAARYLEDGPCLIHGDYFPGSWLRGHDGLILIDPEFCFYGAPEIDIGCAIAHLALSRQRLDAAQALVHRYASTRPEPELDPIWLARFAAVELMRRLIGVAQLPIPPTSAGDEAFRVPLLERSRAAICGHDWRALWPER